MCRDSTNHFFCFQKGVTQTLKKLTNLRESNASFNPNFCNFPIHLIQFTQFIHFLHIRRRSDESMQNASSYILVRKTIIGTLITV